MKKRIDLVLIIISCALMIGLGAAFWLLPDKAISEKENRTLAKRPAFSMSTCSRASSPPIWGPIMPTSSLPETR